MIDRMSSEWPLPPVADIYDEACSLGAEACSLGAEAGSWSNEIVKALCHEVLKARQEQGISRRTIEVLATAYKVRA